ncbi:hypothetical protein GPECTOR_39g418 [Gonium pectorale]|uniref:Uncharacterized protein n=1 Tax=Gonium pectorale TaxID=33097 RepID=A0A150GAR6_GONPE|nr:hypothetical protein GPECTOR_39g418 [Gonium pectorale]|eukprot:KXZ46924.1 hypothetical protein GPECTOR_39g418 [Gonium pectorale]
MTGQDSQRSELRVFPPLLPELTERIVGYLDRNEIAATFRCVNKAAAEQFRGPEHTTIRLSQPVPHHAFAEHWLALGAARGLTRKRREQLLSLTAASGVVSNLQVAVRAAGCPPTYAVIQAAAEGGQLTSCQWLLEQGCPTGDVQSGSGLLAAAAGGGHRHVCEWLLGLDLTWSLGGASKAARGGHVGLMEWLLERRPQLRVSAHPEEERRKMVEGVAHGCDLATLQGFWRRWASQLTSTDKEAALAAAAAGPTPDWAAKVEWLEAQGCPRAVGVTETAAARPDADSAARLAWLRGRGYPADRYAVQAAARAGNLAALQHLLAEVPRPPPEHNEIAFACAAQGGHLAALQALHAAGWQPTAEIVRAAVCSGQLHVLVWAVEALGERVLEPSASLFTMAAWSGNTELLAWLRERGCAFGPDAYASAAWSGGEAALELLAALGCPMPATGEPYFTACAVGDMHTLRCLRRVGVPWGPEGFVFGTADRGASPAILCWLLEEGCPVGDFEEARRALRRREARGEVGLAGVMAALDEEERRRREQ